MAIKSRLISLSAPVLLFSLSICLGCTNSQPKVVQPKLTEEQIQQIMEQESRARGGAAASAQPSGEASSSVPNLGLD